MCGRPQRNRTYFIATIDGKGSVFQYYQALGNELVSRGHRVILIVEGQGPEAESTDTDPPVLVWPSPRPVHWKDAFFLWRLIKEHGPSCIISSFSAVNICTLAGWLGRVPVRAAWAHSLDGQIRLDVPMHPVKRFLLNRRKRIVYRFASHIIANSEACRLDLAHSYGVSPERVEVVPFRLPRLEADPGPIRRGSILYAGRLSPSKGIDTLLRAMVRVREKHPGIKLDLAGGGPLRADLEKMSRDLGLSDICTFHGPIPKQRLNGMMAEAFMLVAPSRREAFGLVNLEAQSVGTPVVASRIDGIPEVVEDGKTGILVPPEDAGALAEAIMRLIDDEKLRDRLGRNAGERFGEIFDIANIAVQADYFEELAGSSRQKLR